PTLRSSFLGAGCWWHEVLFVKNRGRCCSRIQCWAWLLPLSLQPAAREERGLVWCCFRLFVSLFAKSSAGTSGHRESPCRRPWRRSAAPDCRGDRRSTAAVRQVLRGSPNRQRYPADSAD